MESWYTGNSALVQLHNHTETGQHSFLLQADSTRLTPAVLLNSAPVWAEDVQWKLNLRHLGPERANHCTDSLCIQILNHSLRTREGGSEEELIKKRGAIFDSIHPGTKLLSFVESVTFPWNANKGRSFVLTFPVILPHTREGAQSGAYS